MDDKLTGFLSGFLVATFSVGGVLGWIDSKTSMEDLIRIDTLQEKVIMLNEKIDKLLVLQTRNDIKIKSLPKQ